MLQRSPLPRRRAYATHPPRLARLLLLPAALLLLLSWLPLRLPVVAGATGYAHATPALPALPRATRATIGGCPLFPADSIWNADISSLPVSPRSAAYIASIGLSGHLHPDFGAGLYNGEPIGIPYAVVSASQPNVSVSFTYADESDHGPYPIPANVPIEGGSQSTGEWIHPALR